MEPGSLTDILRPVQIFQRWSDPPPSAAGAGALTPNPQTPDTAGSRPSDHPHYTPPSFISSPLWKPDISSPTSYVSERFSLRQPTRVSRGSLLFSSRHAKCMVKILWETLEPPLPPQQAQGHPLGNVGATLGAESQLHWAVH